MEKTARSKPMDKKAKKRIQLLNQRLQKLQAQIMGAKQQPDDDGALVDLQKQLEETQAEIQKLKSS